MLSKMLVTEPTIRKNSTCSRHYLTQHYQYYKATQTMMQPTMMPTLRNTTHLHVNKMSVITSKDADHKWVISEAVALNAADLLSRICPYPPHRLLIK